MSRARSNDVGCPVCEAQVGVDGNNRLVEHPPANRPSLLHCIASRHTLTAVRRLLALTTIPTLPTLAEANRRIR